ncbi:MAG: DUF4872 domain-containing protein [Candidatus Hodarchaeota archaeon]
MILDGYDCFGFIEMNSGALRNILDYQGTIAPHTGEPFTEAMLMGLGGGIGAEYLTWRTQTGSAELYLRFRYKPSKVSSWKDWFVTRIASRIGAKVTVHQTANREKGHNMLVDSLNDGKPVIAHLLRGEEKNNEFIRYLPYYTLPFKWVAGVQCVVVYGVDEGNNQVFLADKSAHPFTITLEELAEARAANPGLKHAIIVVDPPPKAEKLETAIKAGIRDCYQSLLNEYIRNCRVEAFEVWADRLVNRKHKQGWLQLFPNKQLFDVLTKVHGVITFFNSSGGALRSVYADFLNEASDVIGEPELPKVALRYREVASQWKGLAKAALPDSLDLFQEVRLAMEQWADIFVTKGQSAQPELEEIGEKLVALRKQVVESWTPYDRDILNLLEDLKKRLLSIYKGEKEAIKALKSIIA